METSGAIVQVELSDGTKVSVEARPVGEQQIGDLTLPFQQVAAGIGALAQDISAAVQRAQPDKAQVKFALEISVQPEGLSALLVKGSGKGSLEVTLEWGQG